MTEAALIWSDVLDRLSRQIPQNSLSLWFKDATVTDYNGNSITVVAENEFKKITIQSKYIGLIEKLFEESTGKKISVLLTSAETQNREEEKLFENLYNEVTLPDIKQEKKINDVIFSIYNLSIEEILYVKQNSKKGN